MLKYLAWLVLIFGLTVYVSIKDECTAQQTAQHSSQPDRAAISAKADENHADQNVCNAEWNPPRWYRLSSPFFRWPEGTGAWAILLTLLAIVEQTSETRRATNSQREKDRARLFVAPSYGKSYVDFDSPIVNPRGLSELGVEVTQHGATKAFNVRGFAMLLLEPSKNPPSLTNKLRMKMDIPNVIEPTPISHEGTIAFLNFDEKAMDSVRNEKQFIHFFGFIGYEDVFGKPHRSPFQYIWVPQIHYPVPGEPGETFLGSEGKWELCGNKKHNRAT
jgi:hypothetical protein